MRNVLNFCISFIHLVFFCIQIPGWVILLAYSNVLYNNQQDTIHCKDIWLDNLLVNSCYCLQFICYIIYYHCCFHKNHQQQQYRQHRSCSSYSLLVFQGFNIIMYVFCVIYTYVLYHHYHTLCPCGCNDSSSYYYIWVEFLFFFYFNTFITCLIFLVCIVLFMKQIRIIWNQHHHHYISLNKS